MRRLTLIGGFLALIASVAAAAEGPPVSLTTDVERFTIDNGLIRIVVSRSLGQIVSLKSLHNGNERELIGQRLSLYWDANAEVAEPPTGSTPPRKGYFRLGASPDRAKLVESTPDRVEVAVQAGPSSFFQFNIDYRFVVFRGESGLYAYVVLSRTDDMPAATLWQTRFVIRTATDGTFPKWAIGPDRIFDKPNAAVVEQVMDATFRLADGTVKTKYQNSVYWADAVVYGMLGNGVGLWMLTASPEYHNGGPVKQGQTVHDDVLLRVLQSVHFGAGRLDFAKGESWQKVYGPFLIYVNHGDDPQALWADAAKRQKEEAAKWPYQWVNSPQYGKARGTVSGQLKLDGGSAADAWVILAEPGGDWALQGKGYQFFTRADAQGRFTIRDVPPGTYTLYASGGDQPQDFVRDDVKVSADQTAQLGTLEWQPITHGRRVWQIGTFDRKAGEFRNGDDARDYQMFLQYPPQFPDDVVFTIGRSDPRKDWNYAQWSWYCKRPTWAIQFDVDCAAAGKATLTIAVASAQPAKGNRTDVRVCVNEKEIGAIRLPKTGTAGYRGGVQDSPYHVLSMEFDASLLKQGANEITLGHADATPFAAAAPTTLPTDEESPPGTGFPGQIMYDALRLEVTE